MKAYDRDLYKCIIWTIILAGLVIAISGCGAEEKPWQDEQFRPYFQRFQNDTGVNPWNVSIELVDTLEQDDWAAACRGNSMISVRRSTWTKYPDVYREILIYHELGHCVLGLPHRPNSIMAPNGVYPATLYKKNKVYYIHELMGF